MTHYRIYIDEVGNHDMTHADDINHRFLSLTGVIIDSDYLIQVLAPEMDALKRKYFQRDPDEPVIFHRKDMVNRRPPFECLRNTAIEADFNDEFLTALARWQYSVITVLIDKKTHRDQYGVWRFHPYHYCLTAILERYVLFLRQEKQRGDVMVESRGGVEDGKLKQSYAQLFERGTEHIAKETFQERLTSAQLKVKPKSANICGLQLSDVLAHPAQRQMLVNRAWVEVTEGTFGRHIAKTLIESKYHRSLNNRIEGYGQKYLP